MRWRERWPLAVAMQSSERAVKRPIAVPRWSTQRTDRPTGGAECAKIAATLGVPLLPWQQAVLDIGLEYEPDPDYPNGRRFVYREINFGTPRQSGKSVLTLVKTLHRMVLCGPGQKSIYSMQTGAEAARKLLDDWCPIIEESEFRHAVAKVRRTTGGEGIHFKNRSTLEIMRTNKSSGHGRTLDEAIIDEAMHDQDDRREQAVQPAMLTRVNAQVINTSTAGTDESLYWRRKVDLGRMLVDDGVTEGTCYVEYSAPDDCDPYDEEVWWLTMPALGFTQPIESVRHLARTMGEEEFRRALLNQWTRRDQKVIDWSAWVECRNPHGEIGRDMVLAVDMNAARTGGSTAAASRGSDGVIDVELIDCHTGIDWIVPRIAELRDRHMPMTVLVDGTGPIGALIPEMERMGIPLTIVGGTELPRAAGSFYDHVLSRGLRVRPSEHLDEAVAGAAKRVRGDSFVWQRLTPSADISPLVSATLAVWGIAGNSSSGAMWLY
jgi:hypothetical protein